MNKLILTGLLLAALGISGIFIFFKPKPKFEFTVNKVQLLNGFILKGISITGTVQSGCIANDDTFRVIHDGKMIHSNTARILNIEGKTNADDFTGQVYQGEVVTFYIPDGQQDDIQIGDQLLSDHVSCVAKK